ncbi:MAG: helix-turn-helix transcriptional regulator [Bacteroidales bacterium]|nr:helix-turn-helix transcriptional regulator [Bacteroidales bacterium]MBR4115083.1 helix-turn-helix transcriptional regulator [Bacteroidales bacterium]MBR6266615.1 helix-turn-helix transcriptional regulator [Bacteroidales bacterium]
MEFQDEIKLIASKIKTSRQKRNLSVQELAYRCDMERSCMSRIESGRVNVTIKTLCKIAQALDVDVKELL